MNESETATGLPATANYRYAEQVGDQLFVAGQVPHNNDGDLVGISDVAAQMTRCLDNLKLLLEVYEFSTADIRQLKIYVVADSSNLHAAWTAVESWFGHDVPPATLLGVNLLGYEDQLAEVDATIIRSS